MSTAPPATARTGSVERDPDRDARLKAARKKLKNYTNTRNAAATASASTKKESSNISSPTSPTLVVSRDHARKPSRSSWNNNNNGNNNNSNNTHRRRSSRHSRQLSVSSHRDSLEFMANIRDDPNRAGTLAALAALEGKRNSYHSPTKASVENSHHHRRQSSSRISLSPSNETSTTFNINSSTTTSTSPAVTNNSNASAAAIANSSNATSTSPTICLPDPATLAKLTNSSSCSDSSPAAGATVTATATATATATSPSLLHQSPNSNTTNNISPSAPINPSPLSIASPSPSQISTPKRSSLVGRSVGFSARDLGSVKEEEEDEEEDDDNDIQKQKHDNNKTRNGQEGRDDQDEDDHHNEIDDSPLTSRPGAPRRPRPTSLYFPPEHYAKQPMNVFTQAASQEPEKNLQQQQQLQQQRQKRSGLRSLSLSTNNSPSNSLTSPFRSRLANSSTTNPVSNNNTPSLSSPSSHVANQSLSRSFGPSSSTSITNSINTTSVSGPTKRPRSSSLTKRSSISYVHDNTPPSPAQNSIESDLRRAVFPNTPTRGQTIPPAASSSGTGRTRGASTDSTQSSLTYSSSKQSVDVKSSSTTLDYSISSATSETTPDIEYHHQISKLNNTITDLRGERDSLNEDIDGWRTRCAGLERALRISAAALEDEKKENHLLREKISQSNQRESSANSQVSQLKSQLVQIVGQLDSTKVSYQAQIDDLQSKLDELASQLETEKASANDLAEHFEYVQADRDGLKLRVESLEAELDLLLHSSSVEDEYEKNTDDDIRSSSTTSNALNININNTTGENNENISSSAPRSATPKPFENIHQELQQPEQYEDGHLNQDQNENENDQDENNMTPLPERQDSATSTAPPQTPTNEYPQGDDDEENNLWHSTKYNRKNRRASFISDWEMPKGPVTRDPNDCHDGDGDDQQDHSFFQLFSKHVLPPLPISETARAFPVCFDELVCDDAYHDRHPSSPRPTPERVSSSSFSYSSESSLDIPRNVNNSSSNNNNNHSGGSIPTSDGIPPTSNVGLESFQRAVMSSPPQSQQGSFHHNILDNNFGGLVQQSPVGPPPARSSAFDHRKSSLASNLSSSASTTSSAALSLQSLGNFFGQYVPHPTSRSESVPVNLATVGDKHPPSSVEASVNTVNNVNNNNLPRSSSMAISSTSTAMMNPATGADAIDSRLNRSLPQSQFMSNRKHHPRPVCTPIGRLDFTGSVQCNSSSKIIHI